MKGSNGITGSVDQLTSNYSMKSNEMHVAAFYLYPLLNYVICFRLAEIKNEVMETYTRTILKVEQEQLSILSDMKQEGDDNNMKDEPEELDEDNIHSYYIQNKHFLTITDDSNVSINKARTFTRKRPARILVTLIFV